MKDLSILEDLVLPYLEEFGWPADEALRLWKRYGQLIEEDPAKLAEVLGLRVAFPTNLPSKVLGFTFSDRGTNYIAVCPKRTRRQKETTLLHELAHQIIHISKHPRQKKGMMEFEAHLFTFALLCAARPDELGDYLRENHDMSAHVFVFVLFLLGLIAGGGVAKVLSWLASPRELPPQARRGIRR